MNAVIILPTYNERENISILLDRLLKVVQQIPKYKFSILVVDDNSPDKTGDTVKSYQQKYPQISLLTAPKQGLGKALLRGMVFAVDKLAADIILQMDADLSHDPTMIPEFFRKIDQGADFVVGSRYIPGGSIPANWGIHRKIFSVIGNTIVRLGLGYPRIHDWTGGFRLYLTKYYRLAKSSVAKYSGYVFQIAFLNEAIKNGAKITEVPIHFTDRKYGRSKIASTEYIKNVLIYVISTRMKRLKEGAFGRFAVVGTIGFIINTIMLEVFVGLGLIPWLASACGAECAIISNFVLNNSWTFRNRIIRGNAALFKFFQFNLTSLGAIVIQAGTVWLGTITFGVNTYRIWYVLGVGIGLIWNYMMYSRVIWKR